MNGVMVGAGTVLVGAMVMVAGFVGVAVGEALGVGVKAPLTENTR